MKRALRILIVEDNDDDVELLCQEIRRDGYDLSYERVEDRAAMKKALTSGFFDLIVSDYSLPTFSGPKAFELVKELGLDIPFIIVSGTIGEEAAVDALRAGVRDFVVKTKLARLIPAIERELREAAVRRERIAERRRAEEERETLIEELRAAVHARDVFLGIASHELKTPLTTLVLQIAGLERADQRGQMADMPVEQLMHKIGTIKRQVDRLQALVASLLDVARITSGRLVLTRENVNLEQLVREVVAQLEEATRQSRSELILNLAPVIGQWDRFRIETVVANLLSNAIKFGEGRPIQVTVAEQGGKVRLTVQDHGIGISSEKQARIFDKFERAVPEQHYGGLGLGLWIVRQIIEAHEGTIRVESETGSGSTFTVELPSSAA